MALVPCDCADCANWTTVVFVVVPGYWILPVTVSA